MKKISVIFTIFTLLTSLSMPVFADWSESSEQRLVWGVDLINVTNHTSAGNQKIKVLRIDLSNPRLKIKLLFDSRGVSYLANVKNLAAADERVVAAINADFFGWYSKDKSRGSAAGLNISEGELVSSPPTEEELASMVFTDSGSILTQYFKPAVSVITADEQTYKVSAVNKYDSLKDLAIYNSLWGETFYSEGGTQFVAVIEDGIITKITNEEGNIDIPEDGIIVTGLSDMTDFFGIIKEGDTLETDISFTPYFGDIETAAGGGTILVKNGYAAKITHMRYGRDFRTAAGVSQDCKTLYLIAADKGGGSIGMSLAELSKFMINLGVYDGINFDGGGSTQMVARADADDALSYVNSPENGYYRPVINALGIEVTGGERGIADGITVKTNADTVAIGETVTAQGKVFDQLYYGMEKPEDADFTYSFEGVGGKADGNTFIPDEAGRLTVSAYMNDFSAYKIIDVIEPYKYVDADSLIYKVNVGDTVPYTINAITLKGKTEKVDVNKVDIIIDGDIAEVNGNVITATKAGFGTINFTYGQFNFSAYLSVGGVMPKDMLDTDTAYDDELFDDNFTPIASVSAGITPTDTLLAKIASGRLLKQLKNSKLRYSFDDLSLKNSEDVSDNITLVKADSAEKLSGGASCGTKVLVIALDNFNENDTLKLANELSYNVADEKDVFVVYEGTALNIQNYGGVRFVSLPPLTPSLLTNQKTALIFDVGFKNGKTVYRINKTRLWN